MKGMTRAKPSTYTPAPEPPRDPALRRRYEEVLAVIAETQTVSAAARNLGMSRNHFQTILHRAVQSVIDSITPKPAGRPAKPEREQELEAEIHRLQAELAAMTERSAMMDRLMTVLTSINSGKMRSPKSSKRSTSKKPSNDPDPEPSQRRTCVMAMREAQVPVHVCSTLLGVSPSTVQRDMHGALRSSCRTQSSTARAVDPVAATKVRQAVRDTHGLIGAASLGKRFGLPRRACAAIKRRETREMEIERKAACRSVTVAAPGIVRGFDAMHINCSDGKALWLVAADAAVPYRTSIATAPTYDAAHVIAALRADFETHGAPLVLRWDRIACQRTTEVHRLLDDHGVLVLHGPPRYPRYYGQLERQNREHRAWLDALGTISLAELADAAAAAKTSLNAIWARPTLDWCTAEEMWIKRVRPDVDRDDLRRDVDHRTENLTRSGAEYLRARRQAIESALIDRNLLIINSGGDC